jgi:Peptidase A4 family
MKTRYPQSIRLCVEELEGRVVPSTLSYSTNWAGYAVNTGAGAVSQVAASWVVPAVSSSISGYSSAWVGIDGWNSSSVEQIGTDSDYVNGQAQYYAWYEMYPAGSVNLSLPINAGDTISASVNYTGSGLFTLSITNVTKNQFYSAPQTSSQAQRSSAEWIQEAPSSVSGVLPLANFGTISFSGASATVSGTTGPADNSWSGSTLNQVDMVTKTGSLKATSSALTDSGTPSTSSFSVTFVSSGSGGKGGGHKSTNVPSSDSSTTTSSLSAAAAASLLVPIGFTQQTPPTVVGAQFSTTLASSSAIVPPAVSASSLSSQTFAHFGPANDDAAGQGADERAAPQQPLPATPAAPMDSAAPSQPDGSSRASAERTPAIPPQAVLEIGQVGDACLVVGQWLPAAALESAPAAISGDNNEGRGIASAAVVLTLALNGAGAIAMQEAINKRQPSRHSVAAAPPGVPCG